MRTRLLLTAALLAAPLAVEARGEVLWPTPYLSFDDSPFRSITFEAFELEDFEDGALDTPGVTATPGWIVLGPGAQTDSVDADDGAIDGSGQGGSSFYSNGVGQTLELIFSDLGGLGLPTHVGLVWTDVGQVNGGATGLADVTFEAFDQNGISLGVRGPIALGDASVNGETGEDRFFGAINLGGISRLTLTTANSTDWEVDHIQYGVVPEPSGAMLLGLGVLTGVAARAARRRLRAA